MWETVNRTPFAAQGTFARDRHGIEHWVVAVRAVFGVRADGLVAVAERQEPVRLAAEYADAQARELKAAADFAPFRPAADILVRGTACVPGGVAARRCAVRVRVGAIEKRAAVSGRRILRRTGGWRGRLSLEGPDEFGGVRLTWRAALGGADPFARPDDPDAASHPDNPVGRGWTARWTDLPVGAELPLPLIEDPAHPVTPGRPLPPPYGFGPLQPGWRPRLSHAGTYDEAWMTARAPLAPEDFSERFHQTAPADQIYPDTLRGGEPVEVEGLHPDGPYAFRLPQILLESRTRIAGIRTGERLRLIGVVLDGTARTVELTFNAAVPCNGRDHKVEGSTVSVRQMAGVAR